MAKIRHIAYRAEDVEAMANFFVEGLGLERLQRRGSGAVDVSDGTINITILPMGLPRSDGQPCRPGIEHIGFTVVDEDEARQRIEAAGAREIRRVDLGHSVNYEVKYHCPQDIEVDLGHWVGTAPVEDEALVPTAAS